VAERENLDIKTVQGDMRDLSIFSECSFDLIVNPVSCQFVPNVVPVWREAARVLKDGGILISGYCNPIFFLFEFQDLIRGKLTVGNKIPYSPFDESARKQTEISVGRGDHLWFGHTLGDLIGGQLDAGFVITAMYEDNSVGNQKCILDDYIPLFMVTRAVKITLSHMSPTQRKLADALEIAIALKG
jgi:SAM-dependent methyltransferase